MKRKVLILTAFMGLSMVFSGCSSKNMLTVGYEKSTCEKNTKGGVCGSPVDIYKYKSKIQRVQRLYAGSGIKEDLFFAIRPDGRLLVKSSRDGVWEDYEKSKWKTILEIRNGVTGKSYENRIASNSLAKKYAKQTPYIQTRTNVGRVIRDQGKVQKIWVAPVVNKKGDLVSAHEIYAVVKDPKWIIGENTPKKPKNARVGEVPTPISAGILKTAKRSDIKDDKTIHNYVNGVKPTKKRKTKKSKKKDSYQKATNSDMDLIESYLSSK